MTGGKTNEFVVWQEKSFKAPQGFNPNHRIVFSTSQRPAPNLGIYSTVYDHEVKAKRQYKLFATLINACLGLQIIVAAALTALGAANGSHSAVTVFGAINTVIAGFLTYLKGSGLPNRMKYYQHEWAKVREYIEQRERDLSYTNNYIDVHEEVNIIRRMYEEVRADVENNIPDRFVSTGHLRSQQAMTHPAPPLAHFPSYAQKGTPRIGQDMEKHSIGIGAGLRDKGREANGLETGIESHGTSWFHEKESQVDAALNKAHNIGSHLAEDLHGLKEKLGDKLQEVGHLRRQIQSHGKHLADDEINQAVSRAQETVRIVDDAKRNIEDTSKRTLSAMEEASRKVESEDRVAAEGNHSELDPATKLSVKGLTLKKISADDDRPNL